MRFPFFMAGLCLLLVFSTTSSMLGQSEPADSNVVIPKVSGAYLSGGLLGMGDDISYPVFGGIQFALGYESRINNLFFLRYGVRFGQETKWDQSRSSSALGGLTQEWMDLGYGSSNPLVRNYRTAQLGVELFLGANLITFGKEDSYLTFYPLAGLDVHQRWISHDFLSDNEVAYDFSGINLSADNYLDQLEDLTDGEFETDSPDSGIGFFLVAGLGMRYQISPGFGLGVEYRTGFTFSDALDGFEANERNDGASWIQMQIYFPL